MNSYKIYYERGMAALHTNDAQTAINNLLEAFYMSRCIYEADDHHMCSLYTNLGVAYILNEEYSLARKYLLKSLRIHEKYPELEIGKALCLANLAICELKLDEVDLAESHIWDAAHILVPVHINDGVETLHSDISKLVTIIMQIDHKKDPSQKDRFTNASTSERGAISLQYLIRVKEKIIGDGNPKLYDEYLELFDHLMLSQMWHEAKKCLLCILKIQRKKFGELSQEYISSTIEMGFIVLEIENPKMAEIIWVESIKLLLEIEKNAIWQDDIKKSAWLFRTLANIYYNHGLLVVYRLKDVEHGYMSFEHARAYIRKCFPTSDEKIKEEAKDIYMQVIELLDKSGLEEGRDIRKTEMLELLKIHNEN